MTNDAQIKLLLEQGLKQFKCEAYLDPLFDYLLLLNKWNSAYNLTAVRDMESMVSKHLLDSLAIVPWVSGQRILDVGTGAGLPGIPLAICMPQQEFTLLDSNGKKTRFLNEVKRQLNLKNLQVVQIRAENFHPDQCFDTVISRAFSTLEQMLFWTKHLVTKDGIWLAMKGRHPETELNSIQHPYTVQDYAVAGLDGERCCVLIKNKNEPNLNS